MLEFYKYVTDDVFSFLIFTSLILVGGFLIQIAVLSLGRMLIAEFFFQFMVYKEVEVQMKKESNSIAPENTPR
jgi:phosphatidylglycerophosphate synthase